MDRITDFLRSDLFLSLAGGFALGLAAMTVVKPASAGIGDESGRSVTVSAPDYGNDK